MFCSLRRAVVCAFVLAFVAAGPAAAQQPAHIRSSGPLTDIAVGPTLDCQVTVHGNGMYWHPDEQLGECGTFLAVAGGELWGPVGRIASSSASRLSPSASRRYPVAARGPTPTW